MSFRICPECGAENTSYHCDTCGRVERTPEQIRRDVEALQRPRYHSIGFCIRRVAKDPERFRGRTMCAWPHKIYPTRAAAESSIGTESPCLVEDRRWDYHVTEVFMRVEDDHAD